MQQASVSTTDFGVTPINVKLQCLTLLFFSTSHLSKLKGGKIKSTVTERGQKNSVVLSILGQSEMTLKGIETMVKF